MRLSIQKRLLIAFLGLAIVPLLLAAMTTAAIYYRQYTEAELAHLQELAWRVSAQVDATLRQGEHALEELLLYRDLPRLTPAAQDNLFAELVVRHEFLQEAALLGPDGRERVRRSAVEPVLGRSLRDRRDDDLFRIPLATGRTYYGPIHYDDSGEPLLALALPVFNLQTGGVEAILTAEVRLRPLWNVVADQAPGAGMRVYVLDEQGAVVAHRNPSVVLRGTQIALPRGPAVGPGLTGERTFFADRAVQVGQREFRVVAEHDWDHAMLPAFRSLLLLAGLLLAALGVALGAGAHVLRRIVHPIMGVEKTARSIAAGDLAQRVPVTSNDEIGDLAHSFNAMTDHLQHTLTALQSEVETREKAEQSLRKSEAYLQRLLYHLPAAVVVHGPDSAIQYGNPAALEFLGLTDEQLRRTMAFDPRWHFVNEDGTPMAPKDFPANRVIDDLKPLNNYMVGVMVPDSPTPRWAYVDAFPDIDQRGDLRQVIVSFVDVTRRKEAEAELIRHREHLETLVAERTAALRESEARYRTVANYTNDWETWRGEDRNYRYVSPSCERITGYTAEEFMSDPDLILRIVHPDDRARFEHHLQINAESQHPETLEFQLTRRDGKTVWIEHICQPIHDEDGRYIGTRASNRDVTERKQQALELARARDAAQAANLAKSVFLANMSHELRTPMNAILGFAQLLENDPVLNDAQRTEVETIARSGHHLLTLINDVLEISKIEAGKVQLQSRAFDLIELLDSVEDIIRLRAQDKGLELTLELTPETPHYVRGDDKKLRQVLVNLLGNAVKFTAGGSVRLCVTAEPDVKQKLKFEVIDTGCGISREEQTRIFDAFYQAAESTRRGEGTGLGLTISREYVALMGGRLEVESEPGQGSVFRFTLPLETVSAVELEEHKPGRRVIGLAPDQPPYRILIVEDRPDNRLLLEQVLQSVGFDVRTAENGERAINLFHSWSPHLIWMDMRMPVMDGYEATRRIKATPEGRKTTVLALTASAFEEDRADVLATGCDGFLRKPLNIDEVLATMAEHLGVRYVYADDGRKPDSAGPSPLDPAAMTAVDPKLLIPLRRAALLLDGKQARAVIGQLDGQSPALATSLRRLVDDYRFDELLRLCEECRAS